MPPFYLFNVLKGYYNGFMNTKLQIAPSILSADFSRMAEEVSKIEKSGAPWVHVDVMDGSFVPPITFGTKMVQDIRKITKLPLDVHLMVEHPETHIESFIKAGADYLTVHQEASVHSHRLVTRIAELGARPGISIVPSTPVEMLLPLLPFVDLVLIMTVNPGFGGQFMIPQCLDKVRALRILREQMQLDYLISIDGGVNLDTRRDVVDASPDMAVAGSAFFGADDPAAFLREMTGR